MTPGLLGVVVRFGVVVFAVSAVTVVVIVVRVLGSDAQLRTQPVKVRAAAVVLELASNLHLLGLGSAAPHWLDPLERPEPCGPTMLMTLALRAPTACRRTRHPGWSCGLAATHTESP